MTRTPKPELLSLPSTYYCNHCQGSGVVEDGHGELSCPLCQRTGLNQPAKIIASLLKRVKLLEALLEVSRAMENLEPAQAEVLADGSMIAELAAIERLDQEADTALMWTDSRGSTTVYAVRGKEEAKQVFYLLMKSELIDGLDDNLITE